MTLDLITETTLLKPVAQATVPARTKPFNAAAFYQTGTGLHIFDTFRERFNLGLAQLAPSQPYVASLLKANAYDKDIRKELPETHLSTLEDIAALIVAQPGGKLGLLLHGGHANIFYVKGCNGEVLAVNVNSYTDRYRWCVISWRQGENGKWNVGDQILCPGVAII